MSSKKQGLGLKTFHEGEVTIEDRMRKFNLRISKIEREEYHTEAVRTFPELTKSAAEQVDPDDGRKLAKPIETRKAEFLEIGEAQGHACRLCQPAGQ